MLGAKHSSSKEFHSHIIEINTRNDYLFRYISPVLSFNDITENTFGAFFASGTKKDAALTRASYCEKEESPERDLRVEALDWPVLRDSNPRPSESESDTLSN